MHLLFGLLPVASKTPFSYSHVPGSGIDGSSNKLSWSLLLDILLARGSDDCHQMVFGVSRLQAAIDQHRRVRER